MAPLAKKVPTPVIKRLMHPFAYFLSMPRLCVANFALRSYVSK